jgi:hypothetical protein
MLIWFRIKALYAGAIAFGIAFVWAMVGFGVFASSLGEDMLAEVLMPMWVFIFGLSIFLVDRYWHLHDPAANMFFAIIQLKTWSYILMIGGIVLAFFSKFDLLVLFFTILSTGALTTIYRWMEKRFHSKSSIQT